MRSHSTPTKGSTDFLSNCQFVCHRNKVDNVDNKVAALLNTSKNLNLNEDVLMYIAGYIVKKVTDCMKCVECAAALTSKEDNCPS